MSFVSSHLLARHEELSCQWNGEAIPALQDFESLLRQAVYRPPQDDIAPGYGVRPICCIFFATAGVQRSKRLGWGYALPGALGNTLGQVLRF